jgi:hypothetical protein
MDQVQDTQKDDVTGTSVNVAEYFTPLQPDTIISLETLRVLAFASFIREFNITPSELPIFNALVNFMDEETKVETNIDDKLETIY